MDAVVSVCAGPAGSPGCEAKVRPAHHDLAPHPSCNQYLDAMNTEGVVPTIQSAWESVVEDRCRAVAAAALSSARERLRSAASAPPDAGDWVDLCCDVVVGAIRQFESAAVGGPRAGAARSALLRDVIEEVGRSRREVWRASLDGAGRTAAAAAAAALPAADAAADIVMAAGALLDQAEAAAEGPCAAFTTTLAMRTHFMPWLARVMTARMTADAAAQAETAKRAAESKHALEMAERSLESERAARAADAAAAAENLRRADVAAAERLAAVEEVRSVEREAMARERARTGAELAEAKTAVVELRQKLEAAAEAERAAAERATAAEARLHAASEEVHSLQQKLMSAYEEVEVARAETSKVRAEATLAQEQASEEIGLAKAEVAAANEAEALARQVAVRNALSEYVAAVEASVSSQRALRDERDALLAQLRDFTERAAVLPPFYAQAIFGSEEAPTDFVDALVSDRDGDFPSSELAGRAGSAAEAIAEAGLGNIASVASVALRRAAPVAQRTWEAWFGGDGAPSPSGGDGAGANSQGRKTAGMPTGNGAAVAPTSLAAPVVPTRGTK